MTTRFINPVPRFLDSSGNPIIDGEINFYENGTLIRKDTFADVNKTILNPNPFELTADGQVKNVFYDGTARVIVEYTPVGGPLVQLFDKNGVGDASSGAAFDIWSSVVEYEDGALVEASDEEYYRSLQNNNQGNDPTVSPAFWEQVQFLRLWNPNVTYAISVFALGSDGKLYTSLQAANLGNDPISSPLFWELQNPFDQSLDTTDSVIFADVGFSGSDPEIQGNDTDGILHIWNGETAILGSSIKFYGDTHGTQAGDIEILEDATVQLHYDASASIWRFEGNAIQSGAHTVTGTFIVNGEIQNSGDLVFTGANPQILNNDTDGTLFISGDASIILGANMRLHGENHATKARDFEFFQSTTLVLHWDSSLSVWDFQANAVDIGGVLTVDSAADFSAVGILLGAGANPANLLDDVEKGVFTPVVSDAASGGNTATGTFSGRFTKVADKVKIWVRLTNIDTTGMTAGNQLFVQDIPFTSAATFTTLGGMNTTDVTLDATAIGLTPRLSTSRTNINFIQNTSGGATVAIIVSDVGSGTGDINFTLTYPV